MFLQIRNGLVISRTLTPTEDRRFNDVESSVPTWWTHVNQVDEDYICLQLLNANLMYLKTNN